MAIEELIGKLQEIQRGHPGVRVVVGRDEREVDEVEPSEIFFQGWDDELGLGERVVIMAAR